MKTTTIVLVTAVAIAISLSSVLTYAMVMNRNEYAQSPQAAGQRYPGYPSGMMGGGYPGAYQGYPGGMKGGSYGRYPGGMMGSYGGMMSGMGMMGGYYNGSLGIDGSSMGNRHVGGAFVVITNSGFYPATLAVAKGAIVTWVNMDFVQHTVTSGSEQSPTSLFDSHELSHMGSFSYTFSTPGTYTYYCDVHPNMVGTIVVTG